MSGQSTPGFTTGSLGVTEHPIIFTAELVRAILDGRKTQTRRIPTRINSTVDGYQWREEFWDQLDFSGAWVDGKDDGPGGFGCGQYLHVPRPSDDTAHRVRFRIEPGSRLWVREGLQRYNREPATAQYRATISAVVGGPARDGAGMALWTWRKSSLPSIHMPRWASRLTLEVMSVRVERVREISEEDARAEGIDDPLCVREATLATGVATYSYAASFATLWDSINGKKPGCSWTDNPWVWVIEFRKVKP